MNDEQKQLIDLAQDLETHTNVVCTSTNTADLDQHQTECETMLSALDTALNIVDKEIDAKKAELAMLKNEYDEIEIRQKAVRRCAERAKRTVIGLRIAARNAEPPPSYHP